MEKIVKEQDKVKEEKKEILQLRQEIKDGLKVSTHLTCGHIGMEWKHRHGKFGLY